MLLCLLVVLAVAAAMIWALWQFVYLDCDLETLVLTKFGRSIDKFKGKVVWITGASSGVGEGLAYVLASTGAKLVLSGTNQERLDKVKQQCLNISKGDKNDVLTLQFDMTDSRAQKNFAKKNSKEEKSLARRIELARRKLLFYLSWSVEFGEEEIIGQAGVLPAIEAEIVRLNQENLLFERACEEVYEEEEEVRKTEKPSSSSSSKRVHFAPTTPTTTPLIEEIG